MILGFKSSWFYLTILWICDSDLIIFSCTLITIYITMITEPSIPPSKAPTYFSLRRLSARPPGPETSILSVLWVAASWEKTLSPSKSLSPRVKTSLLDWPLMLTHSQNTMQVVIPEAKDMGFTEMGLINTLKVPVPHPLTRGLLGRLETFWDCRQVELRRQSDSSRMSSRSDLLRALI